MTSSSMPAAQTRDMRGMILLGMPSTTADSAGSPDVSYEPLMLLKTISRARGACGWEPRG